MGVFLYIILGAFAGKFPNGWETGKIMAIQWNDGKRIKLIELKNNNLTWATIAQEMSSVYDERFTTEQCRGQWRQNKDRLENSDGRQTKTFTEDFEIDSNGTHKFKKLLELTPEEKSTPDAVLSKCGYDSGEWELVKARFSEWDHINKTMVNPKKLYAGNLEVKPRKNGFNFDKLLKSIKQVPQVKITPIHTKEKTYLSVPLADMHFGIATYEYYKDTQARIINLIQKGHEEILFVIGNDLLHHDNHRNQTASGREIEQADMVQAWEDAKKFYYPLLEYALLNASKVKVVYIKGNHSETLEWAFIQMLKTRFNQIEFDDEYKERKVHMLGLNYIGCTHGDKKRMQNLSENFAVEFPAEWSIAATRTVLTGHLHHERVIDKGGLVLRQLPTGVNADMWHVDMGYTTAHKRFQVFEYDYDAERCIYYV